MGVRLAKDGETYVLPTKSLARDYLHISSSTMKFAVDSGTLIHGFHLEYTEGEDEYNLDNLPRLDIGYARPAIVFGKKSIVATNPAGAMVRFKSSVEAAAAAGCGKSTIKNAVHRHGRAGGWLWESYDADIHRDAEPYTPDMKLEFKFKFVDQAVNSRVKEKPDPALVRRNVSGASSETEAQTWAKAGCTTREEYRAYLDRCLWESEMGLRLDD